MVSITDTAEIGPKYSSHGAVQIPQRETFGFFNAFVKRGDPVHGVSRKLSLGELYKDVSTFKMSP